MLPNARSCNSTRQRAVEVREPSLLVFPVEEGDPSLLVFSAQDEELSLVDFHAEDKEPSLLAFHVEDEEPSLLAFPVLSVALKPFPQKNSEASVEASKRR